MLILLYVDSEFYITKPSKQRDVIVEGWDLLWFKRHRIDGVRGPLLTERSVVPKNAGSRRSSSDTRLYPDPPAAVRAQH